MSIVPDISSWPTLSSIFAQPAPMRFLMLSTAVPIPCEFALACCSNEASLLPASSMYPFLSRSAIARKKSFQDTVPSSRAACKSSLDAPAPSMLFATMLSCAGITDVSDCHCAVVALPLPSTRLSTPWAVATSSADAPLASIMSLKPSAAAVARSRSPVESDIACVRVTMS